MSSYIIKGEFEVSSGIHYEVDLKRAPLGAGGMGQVFKGTRVDENTGSRTDVAVKFLYQDLPVSAIKRSRSEAAIQIKSENLIEMMGFIEMEEADRYGNLLPQDVYSWKAEAVYLDGSHYPYGNDVINVEGSEVNDVTVHKGSVLLLHR
jgi:serine/threonine-protein kinase